MRAAIPSMSSIHLRRGFDVPLHGAVPSAKGAPRNGSAGADTALVDRLGARRVAILPGQEAPGCKSRPLVEAGERVRVGQPLFCDRQDEDALFCSPAAGRVVDVTRGRRRVVVSIIVEVEDFEDQEPFPKLDPRTASASEVRGALLRSGFWPALRQRPYDKVARSDEVPQALFVTGMDTRPLSVSPRRLIAGREDHFRTGLEVLRRLLEPLEGDAVPGPLYLCTAAGEDWGACLTDGVDHRTFRGPHPAGNVGTHIHLLHPVGQRRTVWHVGAQAVADIGQLYATGRFPTERRVALVGPAVKAPKLVRTRRGISTYELVQDELDARQARVINGSALDGTPAPPGEANGFLSSFANQVTVLEDDVQRELLSWALPVNGRHTHTNTLFDKFFRKRFRFDTDSNGSLRAIVPIGHYESVMPLDVLPTQLIKALASHDVVLAEKLGALELVEEDLALCEYVDPSKQPLTKWLRQALTEIEKES